MNIQSTLQLVLAEGEGLRVEFKERLTNLDREIVAMANGGGGSIYIGVNDDGRIVGVDITNKLKSQIHDIARNYDPSIKIELIAHSENKILEVYVAEGLDKPYRCKDGFFMRIGPSSQKLKRDEIIHFMNDAGKIRYDEAINTKFNYPEDFSEDVFSEYLKRCGISIDVPAEDILISLDLASKENNKLVFSNAGILFFAKRPQKFFPEAYLTCVKYRTNDRYSMMDSKEFKGGLLEQIDEAVLFVERHISVKAKIGQGSEGYLAKREDIYEYPLAAIREAIVNAVTHRDYFYDSSHVYVHVFQDHIDIENPGGLLRGLTIDLLGKRSVRRNRLIADILHRAGYIEKVGGGFARMKSALDKNNNPPYEVNASSFFDIRFYKRIEQAEDFQLNIRQTILFNLMNERTIITKSEAALAVNTSGDTVLRELNKLIDLGFVERQGSGRTITYSLKKKK